MAFKVAFIAHTPDAKVEEHRCEIKTDRYNFLAVLVINQEQAVEECKKLKKDGFHSILLCPGFTHSDVAEISRVVGKDIGVAVARGDGPSGRTTRGVMKKEGWF